MLVTGLIVAYGYAAEAFYGWLSGNEFEMYMKRQPRSRQLPARVWVLIFCNVFTPQFLWFRAVRRSVWLLFIMSLIVQIGMWMERFVIIVTSLQRDFLPSSWGCIIRRSGITRPCSAPSDSFRSAPHFRADSASHLDFRDARTRAEGGGMNSPHPMYGLIAEFNSADRLVEAARKTRDAGYVRIDAPLAFCPLRTG